MDGELFKMPYFLIAGNMGRIRSRIISGRAAQYRFDAADNFAWAERLHQVIVAPQFEACDTVILATPSGGHANRCMGLGPDEAADPHLVATRQLHANDTQ